MPIAASGSTYAFRLLIDADNHPTGCTVTIPGGTAFSGADAALTTTVEVNEATGAGRVMDVTAARCQGNTFDAGTVIDGAQWGAAGPNLVVETHLSRAQLGQIVPAGFPVSPKLILAFAVTPVSGTGGNGIVTDNGNPILFPPDPAGRRHAAGGKRTIALDGRKEDWGAIPAYAATASAPPTNAAGGAVRLTAAFATIVGDMMYFRFDATVAGITFRAIADASPQDGPAPLTVMFVTRGEYSGGQILRYRWDFESDGIFDTDDPGARDYTRTFTTPGVRDALLEVTNDRNVSTTGSVRINVTGAPPRASATVSPSNGPVPLTVSLIGSATPGSAPIVRYEWDFQGDGKFDFTSSTTGSTTFRYDTAGTHSAVFRVTDNAGLTATARATTTVIRAGPPGSPTARITAPTSPISRATGTAISFGGTGTTPAGTITKYEWDFQGDGVYDYSSPSTATTTNTFPSPGIYTAAFRVTNTAGLTAIATIDITVTMTATLTVSTDTLRPPGSVNIVTTIGGTTAVTLFLKNKSGQTVRTLVSNVSRNAGTYNDAWDGLGNGGASLPEGAYYAVLRYTTNGAPVVVDLTNSITDAFYNPPWQLTTTRGSGSCDPCPFAPYENNFLQATFTLTRASEVTVSIRGYDTINEIARLFDRRLFGRDRPYTVVWEGTDAIGQLVNPALTNDRQFIFGMTAFYLPPNAVFVDVAPELTEVAVTPNYFDPFTSDFLSPQKPAATVAYKLSKAARVRLQVYRAGTNAVVRTIEQASVPAGAATVIWDGKDDRGVFADKGDYRIALTAIDAGGNQSLVRYALLRVFY